MLQPFGWHGRSRPLRRREILGAWQNAPFPALPPRTTYSRLCSNTIRKSILPSLDRLHLCCDQLYKMTQHEFAMTPYEAKPAIFINNCVLRDPPAAHRGDTANLNIYRVSSWECITAQIAKQSTRLVATNLAVRRRENESINVCTQHTLCYAGNLGIRRNARNHDANTVNGSTTRWRMESLIFFGSPAPSEEG